jgi:hypothetical protein
MDTLDKLLSTVDAIDAKAIPAEPRSGSRQGWTMGRALAHCAQSIEYSMTGYPKLKSRLFRATIGPLVKRKFLKAARMSHDCGNPIPGAPRLTNDIALEDGRTRVRAAIEAFRAHDGRLAPHFAYGACTKDEYAVLQLLHLEDHLRY